MFPKGTVFVKHTSPEQEQHPYSVNSASANLTNPSHPHNKDLQTIKGKREQGVRASEHVHGSERERACSGRF